MNRTAVFIAVAAMVSIAFIAAAVLGILAPEGFLTFTGFIGTSLVVITGFAMTLFTAVRTDERTKKIESQTNGRLTARDTEIARLQTALIERGHSDVVANVAAATNIEGAKP